MATLPGFWGGKHSLIVPVEGATIRKEFWDLLDAFDPDFICRLEWTVWDWKARLPDRFRKYFLWWLKAQTSAEGDAPPPFDQEEIFERASKSMYCYTVEVPPALEEQLRCRLAPFFFGESVVQGLGTSRADDSYPFTSIQTILPNCDHPKEVLLFDTTAEGLSPLWAESITGSYPQPLASELQGLGIAVEPRAIDHVGVHPWQLLENGGDPSNVVANTPFRLSMLGLSAYRSTAALTDDWLTVVLGSTLLDFAMYFSLKAVLPRVYWFMPEWLERLDQGEQRAAAGGDPVRFTEGIARDFAQRLVNEVMGRRPNGIACLSMSLDKDIVSSLMLKLADCAFSFGERIRTLIHCDKALKELLTHPLRVLNTDSSANITVHVQGSQIVGSFPTPKPKGFRAIIAFHHRWITELLVVGAMYPRHPALGEFLVKDPLLSTQEVRAGAEGICYLCPTKIFLSGGDVDTILRRPTLLVPEADAVFRRLVGLVGLSSKLSDKGFFAQEFVRKLHGLQEAATFLKDPGKTAILRSYLRPGPVSMTNGQSEESDAVRQGCFLTSDRRWYLTLEDISDLGRPLMTTILLDDLVERGILHRGLILKCRYCRTADWFSVADVGNDFRCKRCRTSQSMLSFNSFGRPEPMWHYQLDEIVYLGLRNCMQVPLLALDYLKKSSNSFMYADEQEIRNSSNNEALIEIDICCIVDGLLVIGEAKASKRLEGGGRKEKAVLAKYKSLGLSVGARKFVLATSVSWSSTTVESAEGTFKGTDIQVIALTGEDLGSSPWI